MNITEYWDEFFIRQYIRTPSSVRARARMPAFPELPDEEYGVLREFVVGPARDGTMAHYLREAASQDFILDFRSIPDQGPARDFFSTPLPMANLGAGFAEAYLDQPWRSPVPCLEHYDGLIFLQETTRARPNPSGRRGPIPRESFGNE